MHSSSPKPAATWIARLQTSEQSAHKLGALLSDGSEAPSSAVSLVDNGCGNWQVTIHFGGAPDRHLVRSLVAAAAGPTAAKGLRFGRVTTKDWVKESLAGLKPV